MDELASRSILALITNITIERRHKFLTVGGDEEDRCGYGIDVVQGGIPHDGACPPTGGAHDANQYP
jgi:hypothetical protein